MNASELAARLQSLIADHGDLPVVAYMDNPEVLGPIDGAEFNDDDDDVVLVTFEVES